MSGSRVKVLRRALAERLGRSPSKAEMRRFKALWKRARRYGG